MNKFDVDQWRWSVGLLTKTNFQFLDVVSFSQINI